MQPAAGAADPGLLQVEAREFGRWGDLNTKELIALVLVITGVSLAVLGTLIAVGVIAFGGALTATTMMAITYSELIVPTVLTTAGKVVVCSGLLAVLGGFLTYVGNQLMPRMVHRHEEIIPE